MQTLMEQQRKLLLKKFHTLLGKAGIGEEGKREILSSYGVTSSRDLSAHDLLDVCNKIELMIDQRAKQEDIWRKRVIAAIFGWRRAMSDTATMDEVKAIACRAAGVKNFNDIPLERLRSIYNAFTKKRKDLNFAEQLTRDELDTKFWMN